MTLLEIHAWVYLHSLIKHHIYYECHSMLVIEHNCNIVLPCIYMFIQQRALSN